VEVAALDPLASLNEDYGSAVLHLTWAVDRKNGSRTLLAGAIELLPTEVPAPEPGPERFERLSQCYFLYARDVVVLPERALAWFEETGAGRSVRPNAEGELVEPTDPKATFFVVPALSPEPPPPALVTPTTEIPFCADWHGRPRARHLIAQSDPSLMFTPVERSKAASWLEAELHLDLGEFPEFWGSVHLLAPNPVFRAMCVRADGEKKSRSGLVLTFVPRAGRSVEGLTIILEEERPTGLGVLLSATLDSPIVRVPMPTHPGSVRGRVMDPKRGVVLDAPFRVFDVGFNLTTRLSSQNRRVAPTRRGETGYEIPLFSSMKPGVRAAASGIKGAGQVLAEGAVARRQQARGAHDQRWFRDRTRDAVQALRDTIGPASEVFLCDPYFGGDDLHRIVLAISDPEVPVRILTSGKFLRFKHGPTTTEAAHLVTKLAEAQAAVPVNPITVHVMNGEHPPVHDRFLYEGKTLWMLGSSLNHFGGRGTLMLSVPDPDPVLEDLERVWNESPALSAWRARLARKAGP
jgi:hypothetical protein